MQSRTFSVEGHHYALVIVDGLQPGTSTPYLVRLDGVVRWPEPGSALPRSTIRTLATSGATRLVFGSCRTAAPHEPPWTLELADDARGRGVDALYAHALRMVELPDDEWPDLAVFLGDQVYADDSSPETRARVKARRQQESRPRRTGPARGPRRGVRGVLLAVPRVVGADAGAVVLLGGAERDDLRRPRHDRRLEHLPVVGTHDPRPARGGPSTSARR